MDLRLVQNVAPWPVTVLALSLVGCIARNIPPDKGPSAAPAPSAPAPAHLPAPPADGAVATNLDAEPVIAPAGYIPMHPSAVFATHDGEVLALVDEKESAVLPIFVGTTEATSIRLRLGKRRYERPLTHDLIDTLMHELDARVVKAQVDDLRDSTFIGSLVVRTKNRTIELDARPSDAIAIALGNDAPIFVACRVLEASAIPHASTQNPTPPPKNELEIEGCPRHSSGNTLKTTAAGI
jgi:bifunctional DNase/RNase